MWIFGLVLGSGIFLFFELFVFPKCFLTIGSFIAVKTDRGVEKRETTDGDHYIYTPSGKTAEYIYSYFLNKSEDGLRLKCKIDESISRLDYNIVLFNEKNKVFRVINVCEKISVSGYTNEIALPPETAYVSIQINCADDKRVDDSIIRTPKKNLILFSLLSSFLIGAEVFWVRFCLAEYFNDIYSYGFLFSYSHWLYISLIFVAAIILYLGTTFLFLYKKIRKFKVKEG